MNKEEKKEPTKKEIIEFNLVKSDLKKVLSAHKKFALQGKNVEGSKLSWINFNVTENELIIKTTDGNKGLISKLKILENFGTTGEFNLSMALVAKLSFIKGVLEEVKITKQDNTVEFEDIEFNSIQKLTVKPEDDIYPPLEDLIPKKHNFTIAIAQKYLKDLTSLKSTLGYMELSFDTKNTHTPILVETHSENLSQQAIIMPASFQKDSAQN